MKEGPLSPRETKELLLRLGHRPRHALGQNYLVDGNIVRKSLELGEVTPGDVVVEIGPGLGTLTRTLLTAGAEVHAIEADPAMAAHLREFLAEKIGQGFFLLEGDAVERPLADLREPADGSFKVIANLPYAISTPWMDALCRGPHPSVMVLMLQREAAERLTAQVGGAHWSAATAQVSLAFEKVRVHPVPGQSFSPPPKVDSCLLVLRRRKDARRLSPRAREVSRMLFTLRRKQLGASVRTLFPDAIDVKAWLEGLGAYGLGTTSRPQEVPAEAWLAL